MALLRRCYGKLRLRGNESKSAVAKASGRKFLGYSFWLAARGEGKRKVRWSPKRWRRSSTPGATGFTRRSRAGAVW